MNIIRKLTKQDCNYAIFLPQHIVIRKVKATKHHKVEKGRVEIIKYHVGDVVSCSYESATVGAAP